jgi:aspartate/methionine/tyrosine aminotransferase
MHERTISLYTFSKTYAMTGLRLGYVAVKDAKLRDRMRKALFYTASNVTSVVQFGGIGALEGSQAAVGEFRTELQARRDLFYQGIRDNAGDVLSGVPPKGAFYAFLRINPEWIPPSGKATFAKASVPERRESLSWAMAEYLIAEGRIGCVPGVDFGAHGEGYLRFCFARDRKELAGALASMSALFATV